jgi:sugar phosphate isomerase/epimerase
MLMRSARPQRVPSPETILEKPMTTLVQLFSARDHQPWEHVLDRISTLGFEGVEGFFGVFQDPKGFSTTLKARGLTMPQAHIPLALLETEFDKAVSIAEDLGIFTLIGPWLPPEERPTSSAGWQELGQRLDVIEGKVRRLGRRFAWHNHDFELLPLADGSCGMDILLETAPGMDWEADLGWVLRAGQAPADWLSKHAGRIVTVHLKDLQPDPDNAAEGGWADLGHGTNDWAPIFAQLKSLPRLSAYVAEHDMPSDLGRFLSRWKASFDRLASGSSGTR